MQDNAGQHIVNRWTPLARARALSAGHCEHERQPAHARDRALPSNGLPKDCFQAAAPRPPHGESKNRRCDAPT